MAIVRKTMAEIRANHPPKFPVEERRRLEAATEEEIQRQAEEDDTITSSEELERGVLAREVRKIREGTGMKQTEFADYYRLTVSRLRDWEQGRYSPDPAMMVYLRLIRDEPKVIEKQLKRQKAQAI
jgi:putative transcriptional regulator